MLGVGKKAQRGACGAGSARHGPASSFEGMQAHPELGWFQTELGSGGVRPRELVP